MNIETDIKKIEAKMIREYFEDGLLELFIGLMFVWVRIIDLIDIQSDSVLLTSLIVTIPAAFLSTMMDVTKKKLVYPRTGYVNQKKYGKRQVIQAVILMVLALGIIFSIVWTLGLKTGPFYAFFDTNISLILAFASTGYLVLVGILTTIRRMYIYAGLAGFIFVLNYFIPLAVETYVIYFALVLVISGAYLLTHFLRTHPVLEVSDEEI